MADDKTLKTMGTIHSEVMGRDAVHIAVVQIVAPRVLYSGAHVGPSGESAYTTITVGIVDPYLTEPVQPGGKCWLFLYPGSITSLRHEWTHPAFGAEERKGPLSEDAISQSKRWIEDYALASDKTYNAMMRAAKLWQESEDYTYDNTEAYKEGSYYEKLEEFWHHYEIVTGTRVDSKNSFFTCSC